MKTATIVALLTGPIGSYAAYWLVSALSYAMPRPKDTDSVWYVIAFRGVHFIAANITNMRQGRAAVAPPEPAVSNEPEPPKAMSAGAS